MDLVFFLFVISCVVKAELSTYEVSEKTGKCKKMQLCYEKIEVPDRALLYLSIELTLWDRDGKLNEYDEPRPKIYLRYDAIPDDIFYDYKADVSEGYQSLVSFAFPKKAKSIILLLDGGLLNFSERFPAYTVYGWKYSIKSTFTYCLSEYLTISSYIIDKFRSHYLQCDLDVSFEQQKLIIKSGKNPIIHKIPFGTEKLLIKITNVQEKLSLIVSPDNFVFSEKFQENTMGYNWEIDKDQVLEIEYPKNGDWFFVFDVSDNQKLDISIETKQLENIKYEIYDESNIETYQKITNGINQAYLSGKFSQNRKSNYHTFLVKNEKMHLRYALKISIFSYRSSDSEIEHMLLNNLEISIALDNIPTSKSRYFHIKTVQDSKLFYQIYKDNREYSLIIELGYLKSDYNFIELKFNDNLSSPILYDLGIMNTEIGNNYCNNEPHLLSNNVAYICKCGRNTAGKHCEIMATSETSYLIGLVMLVSSNFAMLPAIITGMLHFYYGEVAVYTTNMLASIIYHFCDWGFECFSISGSTLRVADFTLSYLSFMAALIKIARFRNANHKLALYGVLFAMLLYMGLYNNFSGILFGIMVIFI